MWFEDELKIKVVGELRGGMSDTKGRSKCGSCQRRGGLFSCDYPKCSRKYHVSCAIKLGVIYNYEQMNLDYCTKDDPEGKNIFCNEHRNRMLAERKRKEQEKERQKSRKASCSRRRPKLKT